jgi:hypothetical protein
VKETQRDPGRHIAIFKNTIMEKLFGKQNGYCCK